MNRIKKIFYIIIGILSFALGAIGAFIPLLPTTPFLLLASFCFVKGSEKFDRWFKETKIYKRHLENYVDSRSMTMKQKVSILLFADTMIAFPLIMLENIYVKIFLLILVIFKYYYFMFKIKTINEE
ncbi:YbaN family protein [Clostridium sp. MSJ-11]|uniref:YbaN family protein n=1 Tax=Clostridium mobile TaxID=2841512 RepID=A0ABS6EDD5_9CLOT|nr:YbaN family protein [Clostridium mobile]MBU5483212.1 YbaN family protein [Clostridium mobile]